MQMNIPALPLLPQDDAECFASPEMTPRGVWGDDTESGFVTAREHGFPPAHDSAGSLTDGHHSSTGFVTARLVPETATAHALPQPHFPAKRPSPSAVRRPSQQNHAVKRIEELNILIHKQQQMLLHKPKSERRQLKLEIESLDAEAQRLQRTHQAGARSSFVLRKQRVPSNGRAGPDRRGCRQSSVQNIICVLPEAKLHIPPSYRHHQ